MEAEFMKNRVSLGGQLTGSLWTTLFAGGLIAVACSWITLTSYSAQAAGDPNNILLDFSARWCGPCQQMSPIVSKLERQGYPIRQVDVDQERDLAKKYDVSSIPCFVLIANGKEINRITGATDEKQLRKLMTLLPKQNIDEPLAGKSRANSADSQASSKSTDGKKGFLALPPLFPKKTKDAAASRSEEVETVRGQDPDRPAAYNEFAREAITASTRIRVKDGSHVHYGSGTIIDSQPGQAVILTCGHILRKLSKNAQIEVDLFADGISNPMTTTAQILKYDLEADVGLLTVSCQERLPVVKLAFSRELPKVKDRVISIGCGGGKLPSVEEHAITAINGFAGPDNLECTGVPLQGRSGGGLFLGAEQVGVCILADANYKRGIYTGMQPVAQLLQKAGLDRLVSPAVETNAEIATEAENLALPEIAHADVSNAVDTTRGPTIVTNSAAARQFEGAEIVCTIHSKTPGGVTRVIIINQASSRIVNELLQESIGSIRPEPTATAERNPATTRGTAPSRAEVSSTRKSMPFPVNSNGTSIEKHRPIETSYEAEGIRSPR